MVILLEYCDSSKKNPVNTKQMAANAMNMVPENSL